MATRITNVTAHDIRFPTSKTLAGSDAMNPEPDYSAAYVILETDHPQGLQGHGFTFTIGRGNELCVAAIDSLAYLVKGHAVEELAENPAKFWYHITGDSQLRWVGPEKGVIHLATAAVVNAMWDLWAKTVGKPLWKLLQDMTPHELVRCVPFRYITDALTPDEALDMIQRNEATRADRESILKQNGYPAYTTSAGWLGYSDDQLRALCREGLAEGWSHFKVKVGRDLEDDVRRVRIIREEIGPERRLMVDANQVWDVGQAITWMRELARFDPWWIEEPTSPDDVLGHAAVARALAPIRVATGEHCQNRVMFKQLLQANAIGFCQVDAARLGGVNYVQHLSMVDFLRISGSMDDRLIEYVDHLHEHFVAPVVMRGGRYMPPTAPGYSAQMKHDSIATYTYPTGSAWQPVAQMAR